MNSNEPKDTLFRVLLSCILSDLSVNRKFINVKVLKTGPGPSIRAWKWLRLPFE